MFKTISKIISYLIILSIQVAYNLFVIWGLVIWNSIDPWISNLTTTLLIAIPTLIVFNVVLMVLVTISFFSIFGKQKEEEKKGFKMPDKVTQWFKGETKEGKDSEIPDKITQWFKGLEKEDKDSEIPDKITQWFKGKSIEEKKYEIPEKVTQWFKDLAEEDKESEIPDKITKWFKDLAKEDKE